MLDQIVRSNCSYALQTLNPYERFEKTFESAYLIHEERGRTFFLVARVLCRRYFYCSWDAVAHSTKCSYPDGGLRNQI